MGEILDLKTIHDYNKFLGLETLNPLTTSFSVWRH